MSIGQVTSPQPADSLNSVWKNISTFFGTPFGFSLLIAIFLILLTFPFLPALWEAFKPKDNQPLIIDQEYTRDPRYFDKNFIEELQPYLADPELLKKEDVKFQDRIPIDYYENLITDDSLHMKHLLIISKIVKTGKNNRYTQPIYAKGTAEIGAKSILNILMAEGNVTLGKEITLNRWMGSNSNITAGESCFLGKRVACSGVLQLGKGCMFSSLYAMPIATYEASLQSEQHPINAVEIPPDHQESISHISDFNWYISRQYMTVPPYSIVNNTMIVKTDLVLRKGVVVNGDLKIYGKVLMEKDVRVYGELISAGDIEIGEDSYISENLFSQSRIHIRSGVRIGQPGQYKSVVGKKGIRIEKNVIIYGYIMTAGLGVVI